MVLKSFGEFIDNAMVSDVNLEILNALCSLYAVFGIVQHSGEFALVSEQMVGLIPIPSYNDTSYRMGTCPLSS